MQCDFKLCLDVELQVKPWYLLTFSLIVKPVEHFLYASTRLRLQQDDTCYAIILKLKCYCCRFVHATLTRHV